MNPRSDVDFSAPKLDLNVNLQDITIELNKAQVTIHKYITNILVLEFYLIEGWLFSSFLLEE